jgi:hypothetical protein
MKTNPESRIPSSNPNPESRIPSSESVFQVPISVSSYSSFWGRRLPLRAQTRKRWPSRIS